MKEMDNVLKEIREVQEKGFDAIYYWTIKEAMNSLEELLQDPNGDAFQNLDTLGEAILFLRQCHREKLWDEQIKIQIGEIKERFE